MLLRLLTPELRRWDCCKLRASLVCKVSSRWPGLQSETLAKKTKTNQSLRFMKKSRSQSN